MLKLAQRLICLLLSSAAISCTHYYYPMTENKIALSRSDFRDLSLKNVPVETSCTWRKGNGERIAAPGLCGFLDKLLESESEETEAEAKVEDSQTDKGLSLQVEGRTMATQYSRLDHALLWASFGVYPATTDRWHSIEMRVYDSQHTLLESGTFKALFRSYYSWPYFLMNRALGWLHDMPPHRYKEPTSRDFYLFASQLLYNARMVQKSRASAAVKED